MIKSRENPAQKIKRVEQEFDGEWPRNLLLNEMIGIADSQHWMHKYPNLLKGVDITRPEQAFVSDITHIESTQGVNYLSLVTDACSRKIMGHELSLGMKTPEEVHNKACYEMQQAQSKTINVFQYWTDL